MTIEEWKERNSKPKKYSHFDRRKSVDFAWEYISNPKNIASHGFYPFIQYHKKYKKYNKCSKNNGVKIKDRKLCYAAHMDRYIYSYYGFLLNEKYKKQMI